MSLPFYKQHDSTDCGPACLRMVARYYGRRYTLNYLREKCFIGKEGVSLRGIQEAAETCGFRSVPVKIPFRAKNGHASLTNAPLPAILHWNDNHFIVVYRISRNHIHIADPAHGKQRLKADQFKKHWIRDDGKGIALLLEPTVQLEDSELQEGGGINRFKFLKSYLIPHKRLFGQLLLSLIIATVFQLSFPFLTQSLVDVGIETKNLNFIYYILAGQLMIFAGQTVVRFIQSWIVLHASVRINVSLIADYLHKLMRMPLGFFDSKNIGDILQRIDDHRRIEAFLTQSTLSLILSIFNLFVFGIVLLIYSIPIFLIYLVSGILYIGWIIVFLKKRKDIDYKAFLERSDNQDSLIEIIQGLPEIKLQGSEYKRRNLWTQIQARLFQSQMSALSISQYQDAGALSINQVKDIIITFIAAKSVIEGHMTLGMMLAIQYIIGQLNAPLQQLVGFIRSAQDAKISLERLSEVHLSKEEEDQDSFKLSHIPAGDIVIDHLSFKYSPIAEEVLSNINITIPRNKMTAIVGTSGSGKTTLIKLLLRFYEPGEGQILIGGQPINTIYMKFWRAHCGVVMQDGFIFSDTIANNISESSEEIDFRKVIQSSDIANISEFIHGLPNRYHTMIGPKGNGISAGQRQRFLLARAAYKDPEFVFLDEATNALDAKNEKIIMENLKDFLNGKTVVVVAHRLSTVRHADQIIVMEKGEVVEHGTHEELILAGKNYFNLIKDQLALGN